MQPHPPETRARALELAQAGESQGAIARQLDVAKQTVSDWCAAAGIRSTGTEKTEAAREAKAARDAERRENVKSRLLDMMDIAFSKMEESDLLNFQRGAISLGVLIDKYRLEVGEVTQRHEVSGDRDRAYDDARERAHAFRLVANG